MTYDSMPILCRKCLDMRVPKAELIRFLDEYISSLPEDIKSSPSAYEARLTACSECEHLTEATCTLCGCYVQARAAKKSLRCPIPGAPKWVEAPTNNETERDDL